MPTLFSQISTLLEYTETTKQRKKIEREKRYRGEREMTVEEVGDDYTKDGTVDLRGNPVRRSIRGRWKACSFVVGIYSFISINDLCSKYIYN